jgi:hypothetical protein
MLILESKHIFYWGKDIFSVQYHLIEDPALAHCISQPSELPPHMRKHFCLERYQTSHLKLDS